MDTHTQVLLGTHEEEEHTRRVILLEGIGKPLPGQMVEGYEGGWRRSRSPTTPWPMFLSLVCSGTQSLVQAEQVLSH